MVSGMAVGMCLKIESARIPPTGGASVEEFPARKRKFTT